MSPFAATSVQWQKDLILWIGVSRVLQNTIPIHQLFIIRVDGDRA
jgi:hypothetical protein